MDSDDYTNKYDNKVCSWCWVAAIIIFLGSYVGLLKLMRMWYE